MRAVSRCRPNSRETSRMLIPSTITVLRTRRYTSTLYIHRTIRGVGYNPMNDGGRYSIWSPIPSNLPPTRPTLSPPFTVRPFLAKCGLEWPKQLSGLCWERCGDLAFEWPAKTKTLPVCRTQNHSSSTNPHAYLKVQDPVPDLPALPRRACPFATQPAHGPQTGNPNAPALRITFIPIRRILSMVYANNIPGLTLLHPSPP